MKKIIVIVSKTGIDVIVYMGKVRHNTNITGGSITCKGNRILVNDKDNIQQIDLDHNDCMIYYNELNAECPITKEGLDTYMHQTIANEFSRLLQLHLTDIQMAEVIKKNRTIEYANCCATHDYLDANMIMAEAFKNIIHAEPDMQNNKDNALWNSAWDLAKNYDFQY